MLRRWLTAGRIQVNTRRHGYGGASSAECPRRPSEAPPWESKPWEVLGTVGDRRRGQWLVNGLQSVNTGSITVAAPPNPPKPKIPPVRRVRRSPTDPQPLTAVLDGRTVWTGCTEPAKHVPVRSGRPSAPDLKGRSGAISVCRDRPSVNLKPPETLVVLPRAPKASQGQGGHGDGSSRSAARHRARYATGRAATSRTLRARRRPRRCVSEDGGYLDRGTWTTGRQSASWRTGRGVPVAGRGCAVDAAGLRRDGSAHTPAGSGGTARTPAPEIENAHDEVGRGYRASSVHRALRTLDARSRAGSRRRRSRKPGRRVSRRHARREMCSAWEETVDLASMKR